MDIEGATTKFFKVCQGYTLLQVFSMLGINVVVWELSSAIDSSRDLASHAKRALASLVLPKKYSPHVVERMFRRAVAHRVWFKLRLEVRALILALKRWNREVRSRVLRGILDEVYLEIEMATTRGRALFYGAVIALKNGFLDALKMVSVARDSIQKLLYLGISYLNSPPIYRIYG